MKSYGILLMALMVVLLGGKGLSLAGWTKTPRVPKSGVPAKHEALREPDQAALIRWAENRPTHWRALMLQPQ